MRSSFRRISPSRRTRPQPAVHFAWRFPHGSFSLQRALERSVAKSHRVITPDVTSLAYPIPASRQCPVKRIAYKHAVFFGSRSRTRVRTPTLAVSDAAIKKILNSDLVLTKSQGPQFTVDASLTDKCDLAASCATHSFKNAAVGFERKKTTQATWFAYLNACIITAIIEVTHQNTALKLIDAITSTCLNLLVVPRHQHVQRKNKNKIELVIFGLSRTSPSAVFCFS